MGKAISLNSSMTSTTRSMILEKMCIILFYFFFMRCSHMNWFAFACARSKSWKIVPFPPHPPFFLRLTIGSFWILWYTARPDSCSLRGDNCISILDFGKWLSYLCSPMSMPISISVPGALCFSLPHSNLWTWRNEADIVWKNY